MIEFEDDFEIPVDIPSNPVMSESLANEQAFYTSTLIEQPDMHDPIKTDLESVGANVNRSVLEQEWSEEQDIMDNNILLDVISDPSIGIQDKKSLVRQHNSVERKSTNIRDKYIQEAASVTTTPSERSTVRVEDVEAQDLWIDTIERRKAANDTLQRERTAFAQSLDGGASQVIGGILLDFLPLAFSNQRSFAAARETGLELETDDVIPSPNEFTGAANDIVSTFLLTGSVNRKVAEAFQDAPPEQQVEMFRQIIKGIDSIPGTDFNKFVAIQELLDNPLESDILTGGRNILSLLEGVGLGSAITSPVKTIKWYTTFKSATKAADVGKAGTSSAGIAPEVTFLKDGTKIEKADTGLENYNLITPPKKPVRPRRDKPEASTPDTQAVISLGDDSFPTIKEEVVTEFSPKPTGMGRGNITTPRTDLPNKRPDVATPKDIEEDFVSGQNVGQQQAARELMEIVRTIPEAIQKGSASIEAVWRAAGGVDNVPFKAFKDIVEDMGVKGQISIKNGKISANLPTGGKLIPEEDKLMDDILSKTYKSPEENLKKAVSKEYMQTFDNKSNGFTLVRVDADKVDELLKSSPRYISSESPNRKYNDFSKFFDETKHIEVGSLEVARNGQVNIPDGMARWSVLRDKGIKDIPISMDVKSLANARDRGYLKDVIEKGKAPDAPAVPKKSIQQLTKLVQPSVAPKSPAGTLGMANPGKAAREASSAIGDKSGNIARKMGATRAQYFSEWALPKLDKALEENYPDISKTLKLMDQQAQKDFVDAALDVHIVPREDIQNEIDIITDLMNEIKGVTYQQSNSTIHFSKDGARGLAQYGRNSSYGWNNIQDASDAFDIVQGQFPNFPTRIIQKDNMYWVEQEWEHAFDAIASFHFGVGSLKANLLGIDITGVARSDIGDYVIPRTMSDNTPGLKRTGGAFLNELKQTKIEQTFFATINREILANGMPLKELHKELRATQETQQWLNVGQLKTRNAHLNKSKMEKLIRGYSAYRRLSDYHYEWANRLDRANAELAGHKGLYDSNGKLVGLGTEEFRASDLGAAQEVWDFAKDAAIRKPNDLQGRKIVELRYPVRKDNRVHRFAIVGGQVQMGILPSRTLDRVQGYVPRRNIENWYIDSTPKTASLDGREVPEENLAQLVNTVGAGLTKKEAQKLVEKLSKQDQFKNFNLSIRRAKEDQGNNTIQDYAVFARTVRSSLMRGERLVTLNGVSDLEDPVKSLVDVVTSAVHNQVWENYVDEYQKAFVTAFGKFTDGVYPTHISQIQGKQAMGQEEIKELKTAQRLFEYLKFVNQTSTKGDEVWANFFHGVADILEDSFSVDRVIPGIRDVARAGNIPVRATKSLGTLLYIYTNPLRQLVVQPQQLLELNAILPEYAKQSALDIPAIILSMYSRSPHTRSYDGVVPKAVTRALNLPDGVEGKVLYEMARNMSGMGNREFDEVFNAIYETGLPQAADMNSMLFGMLNQAGMNIDPSFSSQVNRVGNAILKTPGNIGKSIGYTPAEMANNVGTWLFTRQRWIKEHPGENWNTPENINTITKQAWDISHSMIGKAGAFPYQNGISSVVLQFLAVTHKSFMGRLMSKSLSASEKVKINAASLALYGTVGVPLGAVSADYIIDKFGSDGVKEAYSELKGGFIDWFVNSMIATLSADGKNPGIVITKALTPVPESVPMWEVITETARLIRGEGGGNPRLPFVQALGSVADTVNEVQDHFKVEDLNTEQALSVFIKEAAELFSGYNNYAKAKMIQQYQDKKNRRGQFMGLELGEAEAIAQLFGFVTRQELNSYLIKDLQKERQDFIRQASSDVYNSMVNIQDKIGGADWQENRRRISILATALSDDPELVSEIIEGVYNIDKGTLKKGTFRDTLIYSIYQNKSGLRDERAQKMLDLLRESAKTNEGDRQVLELLEKEGII